MISKKLISHFQINVFPKVVLILPQKLFLKLQVKNSIDKNLLNEKLP